MFIIARLKFVILGWAGASLFFTAILLVGDLGHKPPGYLLYSNSVHFALWILALPLLSKCIRVLPLRHGRRVCNGVALLLTIAALSALVMVCWWAIVFPTYFPYRSSYPNFRFFLQSEAARFLPFDALIGIALAIALEGWQVLLDFQAERIRAADLERQLAVSRLDALRMQLRPHFLFNTLHTIAGLIVEQPLAARRMVNALGDLLRFTLKETSNSVHTLAEELELADLYLGIEKLRLGDRLVIDYDIESEATTAEVPQLVLQPLFENAVRHGAARTVGSCEIRFRACRQGDRLHLTLLNGGPELPSSLGAPAFGVGLTNTMARLRFHYKNQFTFEYTDRPRGGVQIDFSIPYKRADHGRVGQSEELYAVDSALAHTDRG